MLNRGRVTVAVLVLSALAACDVSAQETAAPVDPVPTPERAWALDAGAEYMSRYLFRGVSMLGDEHVLVPHARFGYGHLALYAYGYSGSIPRFGDDRYQEADFGIDWSVSFGERVALTLGAVTYQYNGPAERDIVFLDTYEIYGVLSIDTVLTPTISYYQDVDAVKGGFLTVGISQAVALGSSVRLVFSGSVGFDFGYNNPELGNGAFNDILLGADLPIRITDALSVHAMVQQSFAQRALDEIAGEATVRKAFYGDQTVFSAGLSYSF